MAIFDLNGWKDGFEALPLKVDQTWKSEWADYLYNMTSKYSTYEGMVLNGYVYSPPASIEFQFNKSAFASNLADSSPGTPALSNLAVAFEAAILASTMVVIGPITTPLWDSVASTIVDPASITVAKSIITSTDITQLTLDPREATIISSFRDAVLSLTYTVTGTSGGNPLTLPAQGVK